MMQHKDEILRVYFVCDFFFKILQRVNSITALILLTRNIMDY